MCAAVTIIMFILCFGLGSLFGMGNTQYVNGGLALGHDLAVDVDFRPGACKLDHWLSPFIFLTAASPEHSAQ